MSIDTQSMLSPDEFVYSIQTLASNTEFKTIGAKLLLYAVEEHNRNIEKLGNCNYLAGIGFIEFTVETSIKLNRYMVLFSNFKGIDVNLEKEFLYLVEYGFDYIKEIGLLIKMNVRIERSNRFTPMNTDIDTQWIVYA